MKLPSNVGFGALFWAKLEAQKYGTLDQLKRFQVSGIIMVKVLGELEFNCLGWLVMDQ